MEQKDKIYEPLLDIENVLPILSRISLFGGLDDRELGLLFRNLEKVRYRKGEVIFQQGQQARYIYIVRSGRVKLYVEEKQTALELYELGVGMSFGETSLIGIQPQSANTIAIEDTELIVISGHSLNQMYKSDVSLFSKIVLNIARESCRRLIKTDDILLHYVLKEKEEGVVN